MSPSVLSSDRNIAFLPTCGNSLFFLLDLFLLDLSFLRLSGYNVNQRIKLLWLFGRGSYETDNCVPASIGISDMLLTVQFQYLAYEQMKPNKSTRKTILVIDDCEVTRERLSLIFKDNHEVLLASTASEGLSMLSEDVGIVILDYMLPDKIGVDVLKEIKTFHPSIPVIIITGYGNEEICQTVFRHKAIDYLKKPFDKDEIKAKVEHLLRVGCAGSEHRQPLFLELPTDRSENISKKIPSYILSKIMDAKNYIDENYMADIHSEEIARKTCLNRTYFRKYFKLLTGCTFKNYLLNKRLAKSKELLEDKNLNVCCVAEQVGYSAKYFPEVFRRLFGISPRKIHR